MQIKIPLDLSSHCIQTELKRCYNLRVGKYIRGEIGGEEVEQEIELLKEVLESVDFPALRTHLSSLLRERPFQIFLCSEPPGNYPFLMIEYKGEPTTKRQVPLEDWMP